MDCNLIVLGQKSVGKSTIVLRFVIDEILQGYNATFIDTYKKYVQVFDGEQSRTVNLSITDIGEDHLNFCKEHDQATYSSIFSGDIYMFVYDIHKKSSLTTIENIYSEIEKNVDEFSCILIGTKGLPTEADVTEADVTEADVTEADVAEADLEALADRIVKIHNSFADVTEVDAKALADRIVKRSNGCAHLHGLSLTDIKKMDFDKIFSRLWIGPKFWKYKDESKEEAIPISIGDLSINDLAKEEVIPTSIEDLSINDLEYICVSHRWNHFHVDLIPSEKEPGMFLDEQSICYTSVVFQRNKNDQEAIWEKLAKKSFGGEKKIMNWVKSNPQLIDTKIGRYRNVHL